MKDDRVYMLNALWFKKDGGVESYDKYRQAMAPLLQRAGARMASDFLVPQQAFIGEWDPDLFFVVEYPTFQAFQDMIQSEEYARIKHLREDALEKSLLVSCKAT